MVPACKKKKFNTSHRRNEITDIEGRQQKHDSWCGKPPVEGSLELGPLPTLHGVSYSLFAQDFITYYPRVPGSNHPKS